MDEPAGRGDSSACDPAGADQGDKVDDQTASTEHILTRKSLECLEHQSNGDYSKLIEARVCCLALTRVCYGPDDPEISSAYCRLAEAYLHAGMSEQAEEHAFRAKQRGSEGQPQSPFLDIAVTFTLGRVRTLQGKFKEAKALLEEALQKNEQASGRDANTNCDILMALSAVYARSEQFERCVESLTRVWELREAEVGATHPDMVPVVLALGRAYFQAGEDEKAKENLEQVVSLCDSETLNSSPEIREAHMLLASVAKRGGEYEECIQHWKSALAIAEQVNGEASLAAAAIHREIATVCVILEQFLDAARHMQEVLAAQEKHCWRHTEELSIAKTHKRIGEIHMLAGDGMGALVAFRHCATILRRHPTARKSTLNTIQKHIKRLEKEERELAEASAFESKDEGYGSDDFESPRSPRDETMKQPKTGPQSPLTPIGALADLDINLDDL